MFTITENILNLYALLYDEQMDLSTRLDALQVVISATHAFIEVLRNVQTLYPEDHPLYQAASRAYAQIETALMDR